MSENGAFQACRHKNENVVSPSFVEFLLSRYGSTNAIHVTALLLLLFFVYYVQVNKKSELMLMRRATASV